jgi:hypothetical protein
MNSSTSSSPLGLSDALANTRAHLQQQTPPLRAGEVARAAFLAHAALGTRRAAVAKPWTRDLWTRWIALWPRPGLGFGGSFASVALLVGLGVFGLRMQPTPVVVPASAVPAKTSDVASFVPVADGADIARAAQQGVMVVQQVMPQSQLALWGWAVAPDSVGASVQVEWVMDAQGRPLAMRVVN